MIPRIVTPSTTEAIVTAVPLLFDISKGRSSLGRVLRRRMYDMNRRTYGKRAVKAVMVTKTL